MAQDTSPSELGNLGQSSSRKPRYDPTITLGQLVSLVPLLIALITGIGAIYSIKADQQVTNVQILTVQKEAIEQKQVTSASLAKIEGKVESVATAVQTLSSQVTVSQALQQQSLQQNRRP